MNCDDDFPNISEQDHYPQRRITALVHQGRNDNNQTTPTVHPSPLRRYPYNITNITNTTNKVITASTPSPPPQCATNTRPATPASTAKPPSATAPSTTLKTLEPSPPPQHVGAGRMKETTRERQCVCIECDARLVREAEERERTLKSDARAHQKKMKTIQNGCWVM
ncbi:hypothetical protein V498_07369 [Pseudogymnoascus sp. VKM F-4517 (FW-2822)]|nr:hypothetical protein V498_07369 [Pseudogymnoascus sp. VKM F-4517 (FW-2822)]